MRLFLASYRFGEHYDVFAELAGPPGPIAVIANACDSWPGARAAAVTSELVPLRKLGFTPQEVDLREYAGRPVELRRTLSRFPALWVRGGNTFVLRAQFARSGADTVIPELLAADSLLYAGYSAGACLLGPHLRGLEASDDPGEVLPACGIAPVWAGLGLIDRPIVPHLDSPTDPEHTGNALAARFRADGIPHWALTDTDVVVRDGNEIRLYAN
ncbi:Type 1 glutamine amidotransferase-like domain-containing protein [Nocardia carnea]|uniref:Type 1 glutamine amidotransferase-like domain-containing protein n=1 Tax=Nocardia carnea TaxID=37328 RepID=UPI0024557CB2|nr:Type 1 glutamine amidotransferase-like domain-containing protein [Nocardia carnea]